MTGLRPYPEYKLSGVDWLGEIPAHWEAQPNRALFREVNNRNYPHEQMLSVTIRRGVITQDTLLEGSLKKDSSNEDRSSYKLVEPGDLAYNKMRAWQGAVGVSNYRGIVSPAYIIMRSTGDHHSGYLHYLFRTPAFATEAERWSYGITSDQWSLRSEDFKQIYSLRPPLDEQGAIAEFLHAMDERITRFIDARRRMIALLEEQKQAIINQAVTRGLDPDVPLKSSGIDWLGDIPAHWNLRPIGYFARIGNGSTPSRSRPEYWTDQGFPWLNSSVVNQGRVSSSDQFVTARALSECHLPIVEPGDLLIGITGQGRTRGMVAVVDVRATINQHMAFIRVTDKRVNHEYLRVVLQAAYANLRELSSDSGSTKGALTCEDVRHYRVPVPPEREQAATLRFCLERSNEATLPISRYLREIELIQEYRTRVIADVVTGKLDVRGVGSVELP